MMEIIEQMMRFRDNDASVEKVVDCVVEIEVQFDGRNITKFVDAYNREMNKRDMSEARQITSFTRVAANNIQSVLKVWVSLCTCILKGWHKGTHVHHISHLRETRD